MKITFPSLVVLGGFSLVFASFATDAALALKQDVEPVAVTTATPERTAPPPSVKWPKVAPVVISLGSGREDPDRIIFSTPTGREWQTFEDWRYCVRRMTIGDALAILTLEQFAGLKGTRITWALVNGFSGTGAILFDDLSVTLGRRPLFEVRARDNPGPDAIQVRGILARRHYIGRDAVSLAGYEHVEPVDGYPGWAAEVNTQGLGYASASHSADDEYKTGAERVGIYRVGKPGVKGASSLNGSHGGWGVAPWHFGPEGWQRTSRAGWQWAERDFFDTLDRSPLAVYDRETLRPTNPHVPYWPGRANSPLPGWEPDPDPACPYLPGLEKWEAHAYSHLHRQTAAAAFLAERDVFARIALVEFFWNDLSLWLDGADAGNGLQQPAEQVLRELPANVGWGNGGRGFAHSVRCYLYARPYFAGVMRDDFSNYDPATLASGALWEDIIPALIEHTARPNGIVHSWPSEPYNPEIAPACRAREVDLMFPNLEALGLCDLSDRCRATMAPNDAGESTSSSFEPTGRRWNSGDHGDPNYYPPYDWFRGDSLHLFDPLKRWNSPSEQTLSMMPPEILFELLGGR